jgi:hypothetical protein
VPAGVTAIGDAWISLGKDSHAGVMVVRMPPSDVLPETDDDAADAIASAGKNLKKRDRSVKGFFRGPTKLYMTAGGLRIVRCSADVTYQGFGGGGDHTACAIAFGENGTYWISVSGPAEVQAEIDPIVDDAVASIRVQKPLKQSTFRGRFGDVIHLGFVVLGVIVAGGLIVVLSRGLARTRRWMRGQT